MEDTSINWDETILDIFKQLSKYECSIANYVEVIKLLVNTKRVNLNNIKDKNGKLVNIASAVLSINIEEDKEYLELMEFVILQGADVNYVDDKGWALLHYACDYVLYENAKLLIKHGANINIRNNRDDTPLRMLTRYPEGLFNDLDNSRKFMSYLVEHGAIE